MRLRTSLTTLALLLVVYASITLAVRNQGVLSQSFDFFGVQLPMSAVVLGALLAGFFVFLVWLAVGGLSAMVHRAYERFKNRLSLNVEKYYTAGVEALLNGHLEEARRQLEKCLALDREHGMAHLKLGDVYFQLQKIAEAETHHLKAHHLMPENRNALLALAEDYWLLQDHPRSKDILLKVLSRERGMAYNTMRRLREIYMLEENFPKALEVSERINKLRLRQTVEDREKRFTLGLMYLQATELLDQGDRKKAMAILEDVLKKDSSFTPAYLALGEAHLENGDNEAAVNTWESGYREMEHPILLQELEDYFLGQNDPEGAIHSLRKLAATARHPAIAHFMVGRLYYRLEIPDEALREFRFAQDLVDFSPTLHYFLGKVYERKHQYESATNEFRKLIKESGVLDTQFRCNVCAAVSHQWLDYCESCEQWDTYHLDLQEIQLEKNGLPVKAAYLAE